MRPCGRLPDSSTPICTAKAGVNAVIRSASSRDACRLRGGVHRSAIGQPNCRRAILDCWRTVLRRQSVPSKCPAMTLPAQDPPPNRPFPIQVAERVTRLPPYLFGRINALLYNKRRAGDDVIDLGMGNPSDPPEEFVIEKLAEAARDPRNHGYSKSNGIANLRREVASEVLQTLRRAARSREEIIVCLGSKEGFSHMCLAMMGPGDTAIVPAPYFPIHVYSVALASANVIALEVARQRKVPLEHRVHLRASVPAAEAGDSQLPAQSVDRVHRAVVLRRDREAGPQVWLHGDQRLRLRRRRVRRLPAAELPGVAGRGRCRRRVHDDEQGLQHGRLARRLLLRQSADDQGAGHDQRLLRLRHVPSRADRGDHGAAQRRCRQWNSKPRSTKAGATRCVDSLRASAGR